MSNDKAAALIRRASWPPVADTLGLALIVLISAAPYVAHLGFYSDDWSILSGFHADAASGHLTITGIIQDYAARPVQGLYFALLFKCFGLDPLGYHLVNTATIAAGIVLFYWLLVRITLGRCDALAAAIILAFLPQLSTVRVWFAASQVPLSMALMLASLHCQLSFFRSRRWLWLLAACAAALASIFAYEIFAPLIAAPALVMLAVRGPRRWSKLSLALWAVFGIVAASAIAKLALSDRAKLPHLHRYWDGLLQLVRPDYDWRTDSSLNLFAALSAHFWWPIAGWGRGARSLANGELSAGDIAAALAAALIAFVMLLSAREQRMPWTTRRLLTLGVAVFVLGHAVFLVVPVVVFTPTGIGNRTLVAGALGVALIFLAAIRGAEHAISARLHGGLFPAIIALITFLGAVRIELIEGYWTQAPALQQKVLAAAYFDLKDVPAGSTIMLDGVCPYRGPAIIFETWWDVSGALSLALGREVHGDVVSSRMSMTRSGLATSIYKVPSFYPFGPGTFVYNPEQHRLVRLSDKAAARAYFQAAHSSRRPCPRGYVARGQPI